MKKQVIQPIVLSASDIAEISTVFPSFIANNIQQFFEAESYYEAEKKLCDCLELSIKLIALIVLSQLLKKSDEIDLPNHLLRLIKKYKAKSLTVGEFLHLARDGSGVLLNADPSIIQNDIISKVFGLFYDHSSYQERVDVRKLFSALIKFRNTYSHASSSNRNAQAELQKVQHYFEKLIKELGFFSGYPLAQLQDNELKSLSDGKEKYDYEEGNLQEGFIYLLEDTPLLLSPFVYVANKDLQLLDGNIKSFFTSLSSDEVTASLYSEVNQSFDRYISKSSQDLNLYRASAISLIGREHFVHQFKEAYKESIQQLQFVAVIGQQGVGKTKLAKAYLDTVQGEGHKSVYRVKCTPNKSKIPFSIVQEIIEHYEASKDNLESVSDNEFEAIDSWTNRWLSVIGKPLFVCIDDFQWADDCSVAVIREVVELCRSTIAKGVVILTIQSEELKEGSRVHNLLETLSHYSSDIYTKQILKPLEREDASLLFQELLGKGISNPDFAYAVSEGNPQQLVSLLKYFHHSGLLKQVGDDYKLINPSLRYFQLPQDMTNIARRKHEMIMEMFEHKEVRSQVCDVLMLLSYLDGVLTSEEFSDTLLLFQQSAANHDTADSWKKAYESLQSAGLIDTSNVNASFSKQLYRYYYFWEFTQNDYRFSSVFSRKKILSLVEGKINHNRTEVTYLMKVAEAYEVLGDQEKASKVYLSACRQYLQTGEEENALLLFDRIKIETLEADIKCSFLRYKHQVLRRLSLFNQASLCAEEMLLASTSLQGQFEALCCKAKSQIDLGYNDNARQLSLDALALFDGSSNNEIEASEFWPLSLIVDAATRSANHEVTVEYKKRITSMYEECVSSGQFLTLQSNIEHLCLAFLSIGRSGMEAGSIQQASKYLELAAGVSAHIEDRSVACESKTRYGVFLFQNGNPEEGLKLVNSAFQDVGESQKQALATLLVNRSMLEIHMGHFKEAEQDIRRCLAIYDELGLSDSVKVVDEWMHLSEALLGQENKTEEAMLAILHAEKIMAANNSQESNNRRRGRVLKTKARAMHQTKKEHDVVLKIFFVAKDMLAAYPINYMEILSDLMNVKELLSDSQFSKIRDEFKEVYKSNPWERFVSYVE